MPETALKNRVDGFATIAQGLMHASIRYQMKRAYTNDIKPKLVGQIPVGEGALLQLVTFEQKSVNLGLAPRQTIFKYLGLVSIGHNPTFMKTLFERQSSIYQLPPNKTMKRVVRYIWLQRHEIHYW